MRRGEKLLKGYGFKIREIRKSTNMSQEELGTKIGVTKSFISKLENEKTEPSLEMLNKIAKALDVDIAELFPNKKKAPHEIVQAGGKWMVLGKKLEKEGITPDQVEAWAEIVTKYTKSE